MRTGRAVRGAAAAAGGLVALGVVGAPCADASSLSGAASPPTNALWASASHGELLGQSNINAGDVVAFWQGFLASYGAVPCPTGIDGHFSATTTTGTKSIQGFFGLTRDGVVGPNTWGAAGAWLVWSPGTSIYDLWQPYAASHNDITFSHLTPSGSWKWQSTVTNDYPSWHGSDYPGIDFSNTGTCG